MFWIAVAVLAAAVTYAVTQAIDDRTAPPALTTSGADIAVYKDQLAEIEADAARGVDHAESKPKPPAPKWHAACCVCRSKDRGGASPPFRQTGFLNRSTLATTLALPLASVALYMSFGAPGMPGMPLSERVAAAGRCKRPMI